MFTESALKKKQKQGLIRGYRVTSSSKKGERERALKKLGKQKYWMEIMLQEWCVERGLELVPEYKFHNKRKWRYDWAVPSLKVAFEYNGIMSEKSRHTTKTGYTGDMEKLNAGQALGWKIFQFTPINYKSLKQVLDDLDRQT
jgi:hypothetical protein